MHHVRILAGLLFFLGFNSPAQQKQITLEDIWTGTFRTERMVVLHSMKNGKQYSVLNFDWADKQFEWMIYPDRDRGIYGGNTRLHLCKRMTDFTDEILGDKMAEPR